MTQLALDFSTKPADPWAHIYCDPSERIGPARIDLDLARQGWTWDPRTNVQSPPGPLAAASLASRPARKLKGAR